jgi:hypothetical protein
MTASRLAEQTAIAEDRRPVMIAEQQPIADLLREIIARSGRSM